LSVETVGRGTGGSRAHCSGQAGRLETREQTRVRRILREISVGPAVAERKDALAFSAIGELFYPARDPLERLVPGDPPETAFPFAARSELRVPDAIGTVDVFREAPDLGANIAVGHRIDVRAPDRNGAAVLDLDLEAARVRTIQGTGAGEFRHEPAF